MDRKGKIKKRQRQAILMKNKNLCGENVKTIRNNIGMTQNTLVDLMQLHGIPINESDLSKMESGKRVVRDYEMKMIAQVLDVDVKELLGAGKQKE